MLYMENKIIGGVLGDSLDKLGESLKNGFISLCENIVTTFFDIFDPVILYGLSITIIFSFILFWTLREKKDGRRIFVALIFYTIYCMFRGYCLGAIN